MRNLLIVNPVAGGKRGNKLRNELLNTIKSNSFDVDIKISENKGDCTALAKRYAPEYDNIFLSGGDGTVFEVMNGLPSDDKFNVGIFPIGTGNDFFASLGLPNDLTKLTKYYFNEDFATQEFDLFKVNIEDDKGKLFEIVFANVFGVGFDAFVSYNITGFRGLPGASAYVASVFKSLANLEFVNIKLKLENDQIIEGEKLLVTFGNSPRSGGGFYLTPHARINDGFFEIAIIDKISKLKIIRSLPLALINKLERIPYISFYKTKYCEFELISPYFVQADGEIISERLKKAVVKEYNHNFKVICSK